MMKHITNYGEAIWVVEEALDNTVRKAGEIITEHHRYLTNEVTTLTSELALYKKAFVLACDCITVKNNEVLDKYCESRAKCTGYCWDCLSPYFLAQAAPEKEEG